jgi:hypothetical protein
MIALLPDYDRELAEKNIELTEANKGSGQTVVYVRVEKLRESCHQMIIVKCQGQTHIPMSRLTHATFIM